MCDDWYANMDKGELNGVVFLEICKAFDSINHKILLNELETQFVISNKELNWFKSYLTNREQVCTINGHTSSAKKIICEEKVKAWSQEVDVLLAEADQCTRLITNVLKDIEAAAQESVILKEQQQKLQFEKELTEQRLRQEQESEEAKRKL
ncbi:Hypothetical predicted protein [Paramuricea clavata]|uniref:Uncharacterized protein n=1 Tax=Paramuricea clavata TaxID=317549 RepID=A0A7D9L089_PARCT|nr:Hypothetical predicted protein [Paramuricea clavata]